MRENRTSGLTSGVGKRDDARRQPPPPTSTLPAGGVVRIGTNRRVRPAALRRAPGSSCLRGLGQRGGFTEVTLGGETMKQAINCALFGKLRDKFCEYGVDRSLTERLERVAAIPELDGIEIGFPKDLRTLDGLKATLYRLNLGVAAVNVNIKSDAEFVAGALTSPDAPVLL